MRLLSFLFLCSFFISCEPTEFKSRKDYLEWIYSDQSGLFKAIEKNGLLFEMVHIPYEFDSTNGSPTNLNFQLRVKSISSEDVLRTGISDDSDYKERIGLLEYQVGNMIQLIQGDTLKPSFWHYENYRGIRNDVLVHVHFEKQKNVSENLTIVFHDDIYHTGMHFFVFDLKKINNPPHLNLTTYE
jgi:hypothetical protein